MSSTVAKKYSYRSSVGRSTGGSADVSIEYSADLSALTRLEVSFQIAVHPQNILDSRPPPK